MALIWSPGLYGAGAMIEMTWDGTKFVVQNNLNASGKTPGGFIGRRVFRTVGSTTYTPTPGTTNIVATVVARGGGGGGVPNMGASDYAVSGGGGAGGVTSTRLTSGFSGATITVGGGGSGGSGSSVNGGTGGTSSFGSFCTSTVGQGGRRGGGVPGAADADRRRRRSRYRRQHLQRSGFERHVLGR
ncbi:unnamed protein product, partial [Phaeothamnion confervicola]